MLRMLDAKTAVARTVLLPDLFENIEDFKIRLVADGMNQHLQAGAVGAKHAGEHDSFGEHLLGQEAAIFWIVGKWLEKISRRRAKASVRKTFQPADAHQTRLRARIDSFSGEFFPSGNREHPINARF